MMWNSKPFSNLHQAFMTMEERAHAAYKDDFAALLTILTLFGIGFPIIIVFLQAKVNERDLDRIQEAVEKAEDASTLADGASKQAENAVKDAKTALTEIEDLSKDVNSGISEMCNALAGAYERFGYNKDYLSYFLALRVYFLRLLYCDSISYLNNPEASLWNIYKRCKKV